MKSKFTHAQARGVHCKVFFCNWSETDCLGVYEAVLATVALLGFTPSHMAIVSPQISRGYGAFRQRDRQLRAHAVASAEAITIDAVVRESGEGIEHSALHSHVSFLRGCLSLSWIPELAGDESAPDHLARSELLPACRSRYAFVYEAIWHPQDAGLSMLYDPTSAYERLNQVSTRLLHDVLPQNYLSAQYLDAPVGFSGRTLREWILADEGARGTLRPYTESLMEWRPPVARIPAIREELYRMGRVFHVPFVEEHNFERGPGWVKPIPNPLYRPDPYAAWECPPGPIPQRFRADSYPTTDDPQRVILHWYDAMRPRELGL